MNLSFLVACAAIACAVGMAPMRAQDFSKVDALLRDSLHVLGGSGALDGGGAAVILYKDGKEIYRFEGAMQGKSYTAARVVPIASATKGISGIVIARLLQEGRWNLDATLGSYFPAVTNADKRSVTLRQLYSFTSGWPGNVPGPTSCVEDLQYRGTLAECVEEVLKRDLRAKPGAIFDYGSDGMHIAGRMAELASGIDLPSGTCWDTLVRRYVTAPLGLTRTGFDVPPLLTTDNPRIDGGAFSSAEEYIRICAMLLAAGQHQGTTVLERRWVDSIMADQTRGATIFFSPAAQYRFLDPGLAQARYGIGWWRERSAPDGKALEVASQGALGFSPWIDFERGYCGVLSVRSDLTQIYPTYFRMKQLIREALDAAADTAAYTVTVEQGAPSGRYRAGDTVHVWAEPSTMQRVFSHWDGNDVGAPQEWHTSFVMPARNVRLQARYTSTNLPVEFEQREVAGVAARKSVWAAFPPADALRGLIFLYHGTGGSGSSWFNKAENVEFVLRAISRGYGCVSTDADEVTRGDGNGDGKLRWQVFPPVLAENIDGREIEALRLGLVDAGRIRESTPVFSLGMSNGGAFTASAAYMLGHRAAASYCADGPDTIYAITGVPSMWNMAAFDGHPEVSNDEAFLNYQRVERRNVPAQFYANPRQPLHELRLMRIRGIDRVKAGAIIQELRTNDALDENDFVVFDDAQIADFIANNPGRFPVISALGGATLRDLLDQVKVVRADHEFYSDRTNATLDFFDTYRESTSAVAADNAPANDDAPWQHIGTYDMLGRRVENTKPPIRYRVEIRGNQRRVVREVDVIDGSSR